MTSSSLTKVRATALVKAVLVGCALTGGALLSGCIADSAEDSDLPWASNKKWEGMAPIAPTVMDRYD